MKKILGVSLFILFFTGIGYYFFNYERSSYAEICFTQKCFEVEMARTPEERKRGLMFRDDLPEKRGMLFDFRKEGFHSIWMKNTFLNLDIVWLDEDLKIVYIKRDTPPCLEGECPVYKNTAPARFVLEINAGKADTLSSGEYGVLY